MTLTPLQSSLYHIVAPSGPSEERGGPRPALILLHGRGADENDLMGLAPYLDPHFMFLSVRAPFRFPFAGWTWYEILEVGSPHPEQFKESYERLCQFLDDVKRHYPVDPERMFLLGFSMGSVMSYALSLTKPEHIAGVVAHSGYIPENTELQFQWDKLDRTAFFVAHGTHDAVIPVDFGRRARDLLVKSNTQLTYKEYPIAHQISDKSLHDLSGWLKQRLGT
jgi:phospholipase/carboxylesterase